MEEDEDTHYCLKCGSTIVGMGNYISHRKVPCKTSKVDSTADDFFTSLELQSSTKISNLGLSCKTGIVTRSKKSAAPKPVYVAATKVKPRAKVKPINKAKNSKIQKELVEENFTNEKPKEDDDWLLFTHLGLKKLSNEEDEKLPELNDAVGELRDEEVSKFLEENNYEDGYYHLEGMDDLSYAPPRSHTGGKWKLPVRESPELWSGQWEFLLHQEEAGSPTDTCKDKFAALSGGKWKSSPSPCSGRGSKGQEPPEWKSPDLSFHTERWRYAEPPATYTGGKWRPVPSPSHTEDAELQPSDHASHAPPAEHTRGKWFPSASKNALSSDRHMKLIASCQTSAGKCLKTAGGLIQYYCSPCNRRLASKEMYKKHLDSDLHCKRVAQENDLEFHSRLSKDPFTFRGRGLEKRCVKKPERFQDGSDNSQKKEETKKKSKRVPKRTEMRCEVCRTKLWKHQLGKHLVSYHHSRRADMADPSHQRLVLDNIHAIVRQAPFQCAICKFYCNTSTAFKTHWSSAEHQATERPGGTFWCYFCKYKCCSTTAMDLHLNSDTHREVILANNNSVPIVINQTTPICCRLCPKIFRYNRGLVLHVKAAHPSSETEILNCSQTGCTFTTKSLKSLQRHTIRKHKGGAKVPYFCSACDVFFQNATEAKAHRKLVSHKTRSLLKRQDEGKDVAELKVCPYCKEVLKGVQDLKEHIDQEHVELRPKCSKCAKVFTLPQQVTSHVKAGVCDFTPQPNQDVKPFKCVSCPYATESQAEIMFHNLTHHETTSSEFACPVCSKTFKKKVLKLHLLTHTSEHRFVCPTCDRSFSRNDQLKLHRQTCHSAAWTILRCGQCNFTTDNTKAFLRHNHQQSEKKVTFLCDTCGFAAGCKGDLQRHVKAHKTKDRFPCLECPYIAQTRSLLNRHNLKHTDKRAFPCKFCPFSGRLAAHLKRHMRLHTGAKPYKCLHCPYRCNILENLRKHILNTNLHPGKKLYECAVCNFATNEVKQVKLHLKESPIHADSYSQDYAAITGAICVNQEAEDTTAVKKLLETNTTSCRSSSVSEGNEFRCARCSFSCPRASEMEHHLKLHFKHIAYSCPHCQFLSHKLGDLKKHTQEHPELHLYSCSRCIFSTNEVNALGIHLLESVVHMGSVSEDLTAVLEGVYALKAFVKPKSTFLNTVEQPELTRAKVTPRLYLSPAAKAKSLQAKMTNDLQVTLPVDQVDATSFLLCCTDQEPLFVIQE